MVLGWSRFVFSFVFSGTAGPLWFAFLVTEGEDQVESPKNASLR